MCGIVGLLAKRPALRPRLGRLLEPMFACMGERGPDSAGLAVFAEPLAGGTRRYSLFVPDRKYPWDALLERFRQAFPQSASAARIDPRDNHAELVTAVPPPEVRAWLAECDPAPTVLAVGRSVELYKDMGHPTEIARRYNFAALAGSHGVGHTRMATESDVTPAHAHPYSAGEDFCMVHNGSLSNPYLLRRKLERQGVRFETDNDTEAACRFLQWRLEQGDTLEAALRQAFRQLDGFYTLLIGTADRLTLVRDAFACKPAVVAETDDYVAISSEYRSLAHLPGIDRARIFEPRPEEIYSWKA
jgi:glutamate synthase domain-containing protein 1